MADERFTSGDGRGTSGDGGSTDAEDELTDRDPGSGDGSSGDGGGFDIPDSVYDDISGGSSGSDSSSGGGGGRDRSTDRGITSGDGDTTTEPVDSGGSNDSDDTSGRDRSTDRGITSGDGNTATEPSDQSGSQTDQGGSDTSTRQQPDDVQERATEVVAEDTRGDGIPGTDRTQTREPDLTPREKRYRDRLVENNDALERGDVTGVAVGTAAELGFVTRNRPNLDPDDVVAIPTEFSDDFRRRSAREQLVEQSELSESDIAGVQQTEEGFTPEFTQSYLAGEAERIAGVLGPSVQPEDVSFQRTNDGAYQPELDAAARQALARDQFEADVFGGRRPSDGGLTAGDDVQQVTTDPLQRFDPGDFVSVGSGDGTTFALSPDSQRTALREQLAARYDGVSEGDVVVEETTDGVEARLSEEALQEQFAGEIPGAEGSDIVLEQRGDEYTIDREATARRVSGADQPSEPGVLAQGAGFLSEGARSAAPARSQALFAVAESLRTEEGIELQGPLSGVSLPGGSDIDAARGEFEPVAQDLDRAATDAGGAVRSGIEGSGTTLQNAGTALPGLPPGLGTAIGTLASTEFGEEAIGRGTSGGLRALNPARGAQDALTAGEYTIRGVEAATDEQAAETLQTAGEAGVTLGELAATEGAPAAAEAAREDPEGAAAVAIGGGLVLGAGAVTGAAAARGGGAALRGASRAPGAARRVGSESLSMARRSGRRIARREQRPRVSVERDSDAGLIEINGQSPTELGEHGLAQALVRARNARQDISRGIGVRAAGYAADADLATQRGLVGAQNLRQDAQLTLENSSFDEIAGRGLVRARNARQDIRRGVGVQAGRLAVDADLALQRGLVGAQNLRYDTGRALENLSFDEFAGRGLVRGQNARQDFRRAAGVRATGYAADIDLALGRASTQYQNLRFGTGEGSGVSTDIGDVVGRGLVRAQNVRQDIRRGVGVQAAGYAADADLALQRGLVGAQNLRYDTRWALEDLSFDEFVGRGIARTQNAQQDARMSVGRRLTGTGADLDLALQRGLVGAQNLRYDTRWALESAPDAFGIAASRGLLGAQNLRNDAEGLGDLTLRIRADSPDGQQVVDVEDLRGPSTAEVPMYRSRDADGYEPGADIPESGAVGENTLTQESLTDVGGGQVARIRGQQVRRTEAPSGTRRSQRTGGRWSGVEETAGGLLGGIGGTTGRVSDFEGNVSGAIGRTEAANDSAVTGDGFALDPDVTVGGIGRREGIGTGIGVQQGVGQRSIQNQRRELRQETDQRVRLETGIGGRLDFGLGGRRIPRTTPGLESETEPGRELSRPFAGSPGAAEDPLFQGWLSETFFDITTTGTEIPEAPSQETLRAQPSAAFQTGEFPTAQELDDPEIAAGIDDVRALFDAGADDGDEPLFDFGLESERDSLV